MGNIATELGDLTNQVGDMNSRVEQANNDRVAAVEAKRDAEAAADQANQARAAAERERDDLATQLADTERALTTMSAQAQDLDTTLKMVVAATGYNLDGAAAVPQIDGAVLQYYSDLKLVHINRGTNDQVKRGFVFDIFSGGVYKGQARVEVVNPGTCTAVVLNSVDGTQIMQGDRVSTQI
jgi:hypothetical protein